MLIVKGAVAAGLILAVLDAIWLGLIAREWLAGQLGPLMRPSFLIVPAILFYIIYSVGLGVFAVAPALENGGWPKAAILGAFLGLVAYGTYDLTNLATLKSWPLAMVIVDLVWGVALSAVSAGGGVLVLKALKI